jgi:hypothetical protein
MRIINILFALILAAGLFLPFNYPVQAATEVETVDSEGSVTGGGYNGVPADYTALNDNLDTNFLVGYSTYTHTYNMSNFSGGVISGVSVTARVQVTSSTTGYIVCRIAGTNYISSAISSSVGWKDITSSTFGGVLDKNPATGLDWTTSTLNAAEWGIYATVPTNYVLLTKLYLTVTYTARPVVTTQAVSSVTATTATGNGNVTSDGGSPITERGTVYSLAANPTTADTKDTSVGTTGAFTTSIDTLTKGTLYHVRAYGINAIGTSYGADVEFTTINDPTISTTVASLVTSTTARLNSQVTFDGKIGGGEACTVTFVYAAGSPYADYAAILAAGGTEVVAAGTYTVGQFPNYDVAGLTIGTLYSFAVKVVNSTTTVAYGSVLTFTTATGISDANNLTAIPTSTTVSLAWVKGLGSGYTLVRYSASGYPTTVADGMLAYLGVGNSYMLTGLTAGTTYYFSAWGKTGALYASGYATAMATTLAFDTAVSTGTLETPPTNTWWNQTPSTTKVSNIPLASGLISANATAYGIPESSLWYFLWILFSVGTGVFIWAKSGNNLPMSLGAQALLFALGAVLGSYALDHGAIHDNWSRVYIMGG